MATEKILIGRPPAPDRGIWGGDAGQPGAPVSAGDFMQKTKLTDPYENRTWTRKFAWRSTILASGEKIRFRIYFKVWAPGGDHILVGTKREAEEALLSASAGLADFWASKVFDDEIETIPLPGENDDRTE